MTAKAEKTVALTIAGSDSGGGAGIQADLRAFAQFGVFGTSVITAVTAQNPAGVRGVHAVDAESVLAQLGAVLDAFDVGAAKTGMMFNAEIIRAVAAGLRACPRRFPLVVDPVMVATSGSRLLRDDAADALCRELLPLAAVITPNLPEAEVLCGHAVRSPQEAADAARELAARFGTPVLLKGGHSAEAPGTDLFCERGGALWRLRSPVVAEPASAHGTGCSLSAAAAACLAKGMSTLEALRHAKAYVYGALCGGVRVGQGTFAMWPAERLPLDEIVVEKVGDIPRS